MRKNALKYMIACAVLMAAPLMVNAQNMRTGYFMDGYAFKYKMNPAMGSSRGFFALPVLGNFNMGVESNLGMTSVLYPKQDGSGLTTFLNSEVDASAAMKKFDDRNYMDMNTDLSLLALGFWGRKGRIFHNVDLSIKADIATSLPYDLFRFAKEGSVNGNVFDLSETGVNVNSHISWAYGFSLPIGRYVRFGARAKFLLGLADANVSLKGTQVTTGAEGMYAVTDGTLQAALPLGMYLPLNEQGYVDWEESIKTYSFEDDALTESFTNLGGAVDLGVTVDFLRDFTASVSVTDLGFISWNNYSAASAARDADGNPKKTYIVKSGEDFDENLGETLLKCLDFNLEEDRTKKVLGLDPTLYVGLEYRMPFYRRMSVGLLSTTKIARIYTWSEGRLSVNVNPTNWFSVATNYACSTFGHSAGFALTFHLPGFNFFMGTDSYIPMLNISPQFIPLNRMNTSVTYGINIMFGKYCGKYAAK